MADWFSELVAQVWDEVVNSPETASRLKVTGQAAPEDLREAPVNAEDELRAQFADNVRAIQEIRDNIQRLEDDALPREKQAVRWAEQRLSHTLISAQQPDPPGESAEATRQALENARQARLSKYLDQLQSMHRLEADRAQRLSVLHDLMYPALMLRANQVIDRSLEASYERTFSYAGPAILTDPLEVSVQPVNTDAYQKINYLIEKVRSGTIGVSGPRGSGKSTLLSHFAVTKKIDDKPTQWGVCVPAPAKYDARDFLLHLFAQLCIQVLGPDRAREVESRLTSPEPSKRTVVPMVTAVLFIGAAVLACFAVVIGLRTAQLGESPDRMADLEIASCCAIVCLIIVWATGGEIFAPEYWPSSGYRHESLRNIRMPLWLFGFLVRLIAVLSGLTATALFCLLLAGGVVDPGYLAAGGLGVASVTGLYLMRLVGERYPAEAFLRESPVRSSVSVAEEWYARVKFQQSYSTGWSGTITVGGSSLPLPVQAQGGRTGSTAVTPVAMSTPEIVGEIKAFAQKIAIQRRGDGSPETRIPVIIGIDEVDKIDDPADAQAFLNQVKGLFGDSTCLFLVSISDDAMAAFERRGMPFRDVFDSSLSSVVTLSYLARREARTLTGSRLVGVQEPVADLLFVLAGGLARDLVRLIRRAVEAGEAGKTELDDLARTLIAAEAETKKRAILARARTLESCPAKEGLLAWAGKRDPGASEAGAYYTGLLTEAGSMIGSACDGTAHQPAARDGKPDPVGCPAAEIGAFTLWLATVGQVFAGCSRPEDFAAGEAADGEKSFEWLAEARQNFPLGPDYVLAATRQARTAWDLPDGTPSDTTLTVVSPVAQ